MSQVPVGVRLSLARSGNLEQLGHVLSLHGPGDDTDEEGRYAVRCCVDTPPRAVCHISHAPPHATHTPRAPPRPHAHDAPTPTRPMRPRPMRPTSGTIHALGAKWQRSNMCNRTLLHYCVELRAWNVVDYLLQVGIPVDQRDGNLCTSLHSACKKPCLESAVSL